LSENKSKADREIAYQKISAVPDYSKTVILSEETHVKRFSIPQRWLRS